MKSVPVEIVEKTWHSASRWTPDQAQEIIGVLSKSQPILLSYLMDAGEDVLSGQERELLLYIGIVIWKAMSLETQNLQGITEFTLEEAEVANLRMLEELEAAGESAGESIDMMLGGYNQSEVLRYAVEAVLEGAEECLEGDVTGNENPSEYLPTPEENKGMLVLYLKTVIDCLDG